MLVPKETDTALKTKAKFIKLLSNGKLLIVYTPKPDETNTTVSVWTVHKLVLEGEFIVVGEITCVLASAEYFFIALASNKVLVYD